MPLHPQAAAFLNQVTSSGAPPLHALSPSDARGLVDGAPDWIGPGPDVALVEPITIAVTDTDLAGRLYRPDPARGTIVWFHGGCWVTGGLDTHDAMCRRLANATGCAVVAVAYRLAPEHPFPTPLEDCWDALRWVAQQEWAHPLLVGGDSAGGNMAAVCALRARDRPGPALAGQILVYPITDCAMDTASYREHGGEGTMLGALDMAWAFEHYVPEADWRVHPEVSPLRTEDLSGLASAILVTDEFDPLRDEGLAYGQRLRDADVDVTTHHYDDMMHVFVQFANLFDRGQEAIQAIGADVRAMTAPEIVY